MSTAPTPLLLATTSIHKVREITELLQNIPQLEIVSLRDHPALEAPVENGPTMRDNARLKAESCCHATNLPALADDSGIEVDALDGAPGVLSARWVAGSDADRTLALLERLHGVPLDARTARYRCAICITYPDGSIIETEATCEGRIALEPRGDNGFGYDPIFEITAATGAPLEWIEKTIAEAPSFVKAQVSHRARALAAIKLELCQKL